MHKWTALFFRLGLLISLFPGAHAVAESTGTALPRIESLLQQARDKHLADSDDWHRIVHYQRNLLGSWVSEATGSSFFVAPSGRRDPEAELEATLRGFFSPTLRVLEDPKSVSQTVRCQFPRRWEFLSEALHISDRDLPPQTCPDYETFRNKLDAHSVTLVFSSYHGSNPSSVFGHTLLRLNRLANAGGTELLDNGVNYAANSTTNNPLLYALLGLAGGFHGVFSDLPFYYKVREYNDFESRDLWEYDLNLSQAEVNSVVKTIWEHGSTYFPYYYLTKNCSYHLLAVLDAAVPRIHLLDHMTFWVIPIDTVRALDLEPGLVSRVKLRPSIQNHLNSRVALLTANERDRFAKMIKTPELSKADLDADLSTFDSLAQARILDAVADNIDYKYAVELQDKNPQISAWKQVVLLARSKLPVDHDYEARVSEKANISERPDKGHRTGRIFAGAGLNANQHLLLTAQVRFALHDLLDPLEGYPPFSSVEFMRVSVSAVPAEKAYSFDELRLVGVTSLATLSRFNRGFSWRFELGGDRVQDDRCASCFAPMTLMLGGLSVEPIDKLLLYGLLGPKIATAPAFQHEKISVEAQALLGTRVTILPRWSLGGEMTWGHVFSHTQFETRQFLAHSRWVPDLVNGVDLSFGSLNERGQAALSWVHYF